MTLDPGWHVTDRAELLDALSAAQHAALAPIVAAAAELDLPIYLVGGIVRDLVMGRPHGPDLDVVVEGDALALGARLVRRAGGALTRYPAFGTATWFKDDAAIDLVTARHETYAVPGALPQVEPGGLPSDLFRRDFTVNAMALTLRDGDRGRLVDPHGGEVDVGRQVMAVLHPRSFLDDPTRILRGLRLAERLGFTLEANTAHLIDPALLVLSTLSPARLLAEVEYAFTEASPAGVLGRWVEVRALDAISPGLGLGATDLALLADAGVDVPNGPSNTLAPDAKQRSIHRRIVAWLAGQSPAVARAAADRLGLPREALGLLDQVLRVTEMAGSAGGGPLGDPAVPVSVLHDALSGCSPDALQLVAALVDETASANLRRYLVATVGRPALVTGDDLAAMGLAPGPRFRPILAAVYAAQLDGQVRSRDDALALARRLAHEFQ